tara:strand:+ start:135 stop:518 length:384 start_codon:yes stop_codon:yes gene_type:complete
MNLPTNYDTTGKTLSACTKTQTAFVKFLYDEGFTTKDDVVFNRSYLTTLANKHGVTWPPAWIVKDVSRCIQRGYYAIPELNDYIESVITPDQQQTDGDGLADSTPPDFIEDNPLTDVNEQAVMEMLG